MKIVHFVADSVIPIVKKPLENICTLFIFLWPKTGLFLNRLSIASNCDQEWLYKIWAILKQGQKGGAHFKLIFFGAGCLGRAELADF